MSSPREWGEPFDPDVDAAVRVSSPVRGRGVSPPVWPRFWSHSSWSADVTGVRRASDQALKHQRTLVWGSRRPRKRVTGKPCPWVQIPPPPQLVRQTPVAGKPATGVLLCPSKSPLIGFFWLRQIVRQNFDVPYLENARATLSVAALGHSSILILIYEVRMLPLLRLAANRRLR